MYLGTPSEGNTTFAEPGASASVGERLAATFKPSSGSLMGEDENTPDNARLTGAYQELVSASTEQARLAGHLSSRTEAMADAADIRIKTVQGATGVQLNNPFRQGYYLEAQQRYDDARGRGEDVGPRAEYVNREQLNIFNEKVDAAASNHPEPLTFTPLSEWATSLATGAEGRANFARADLAAAGGGTVNTFAAEIAGGLYGARRDPVSVVSLVVGPSAAAGRTVLARVAVSAMSQGFFNLGILALERPEVRAWRDARGQDPGSALPSAAEVGMAFAMGAIPGAGIQGAIEAKGAAALKRVLAGEASVSEIRTAADALGQKLDADTVATLQAGERANQAAAAAHDPLPGATPAADDAAAQALRHAADPAEPPAPLVPVVEAKPPALVVAREMPDGTVRYGKPGDIHADLIDKAELTAEPFFPPPEDSLGFARPGGKFLSRAEALDFVKANEPERAALAHEPTGLQAEKYNDPAAAYMDKFATDPLAGVAEMRGNPALVESALASRDPSLQGAAKLATLSDQAFGMVRDGKASPEHGAIVADYAANGADHAAALDRVTKADPKTPDEARAIVADTVEGLAQRRNAIEPERPRFETPEGYAPPDRAKSDIFEKVPLAREDGSVIMAGRDALASVGERENFLADLVGACK